MTAPPDDLAETATEHESTQPTASVVPAKQVFGRYEIESLLGAGGMGVVYAAFDQELQRRVAVKVLPDAKQSQIAGERLLREARAMARLTHPNVVRVYEVDSVDGHDLVVMELVDGGNLSQWLRGAKRASDEIVAKFVAAGRGLAAAHAAGVVHRDFKPHNVLCATDGRTLVTDFGLAREIDSSASQDGDDSPAKRPTLDVITAAGSVVGTPAYMAPEQRLGHKVEPAADQFSFCVALWEALTGARPYRGNREEILAAYERGPEALDVSLLPRRLRAPLLRGLAIDPAKRWPSMTVLLRELTTRSRRFTAMVVAVAAVALALVGFAVGGRDRGVSCSAAALDPGAVWSPITSVQLVVHGQRGVARMLDRDVANWRDIRARACKAEPVIREAQLACLDGVLSRLDALVHAGSSGANPIYGEELIDPTICQRDTPPRLPRAASPEFRDVLADLTRERRSEVALTPAELDGLEARAKAEPCARAIVMFARAKSAEDPSVITRTLGEAELLAEQCGDEHLHASLLVYGAAADSGGDEAKQRAQRARAAVDRVPAADLQAKVELLDAYDAIRDKRLDDAITHAESAITRFEKRGCIMCATQAAITALNLRITRATPADLEAVPRMIDRYRELALSELGPDSEQRSALEAFHARWLFMTGKLDEGHAVLDSIHHELPITKPRHIHVRVVDRDGAPVAGATVTAGDRLLADSRRAAFAYGSGAETRTGKTDSHGELEMETVSEGLAVAELTDRRSAPVALDDRITLVLEPTSRITGKVELNGIAPATVTIEVQDPTAPTNAQQMTIAAPHADGTFEVGGILRRRMRVTAAFGDLGGGSLSNVVVDVDRPTVDGVALSVGGARRTVNVLVRSTVGTPVAAAYVTIYPGAVASSDARTMSTRSDTAAVATTTQVEPAKLPPDVKALAHGDDQLATIDRAPPGLASACAIGYPRSEDMDDHTREQARNHLERIEVRCVAIPEAAKVVVVEVPPFPRFD